MKSLFIILLCVITVIKVKAQGSMPSIGGSAIASPVAKKVVETKDKKTKDKAVVLNKKAPKASEHTHPCSKTLTEIGGKTHQYYNNYKNSLVSEISVGLGDQIIFKNTNRKDCPIKTCNLFHQGCTKPYLGKNINTNLAYPFQIKLINTSDSWSDVICYKCSNGHQTVTADRIYIANCNGTDSSWVQ